MNKNTLYNISNELKPILMQALAEGNEVDQVVTTYSGVKAAFHMKNPMSKTIEEKFKGQPGIKFWLYKGSPQNPPDNGFEAPTAKENDCFPSNEIN